MGVNFSRSAGRVNQARDVENQDAGCKIGVKHVLIGGIGVAAAALVVGLPVGLKIRNNQAKARITDTKELFAGSTDHTQFARMPSMFGGNAGMPGTISALEDHRVQDRFSQENMITGANNFAVDVHLAPEPVKVYLDEIEATRKGEIFDTINLLDQVRPYLDKRASAILVAMSKQAAGKNEEKLDKKELAAAYNDFSGVYGLLDQGKAMDTVFKPFTGGGAKPIEHGEECDTPCNNDYYKKLKTATEDGHLIMQSCDTDGMQGSKIVETRTVNGTKALALFDSTKAGDIENSVPVNPEIISFDDAIKNNRLEPNVPWDSEEPDCSAKLYISEKPITKPVMSAGESPWPSAEEPQATFSPAKPSPVPDYGVSGGE
jgi:hypothetical protein